MARKEIVDVRIKLATPERMGQFVVAFVLALPGVGGQGCIVQA